MAAKPKKGGRKPEAARIEVVTRPAKTEARPSVPGGRVQERRGWWRRLTGWGRVSQRDEMRAHLAAVKAGVMNELEALGKEKGVALSGQPFRNVVLPPVRKKRRVGVWTAALLAGVVLLLGVVWWVENRELGPGATLHRAVATVKQGDVEKFKQRVDVAAVASSVVNQIFASPQVNLAVLPAQVQNDLRGGTGARMMAFIKPGLAEVLQDEMLTVVAQKGDFHQLDERSLLGRVWRDLGEGRLEVGGVEIAMQDEQMAVAEVVLQRRDLGLVLPLQVVLDRSGPRGAWRVADIPNFSAVLDSMAQAERAAEARVNAAMGGKAGQLEVSNVRKGRADEDGLLVTMTMKNTGAAAMEGLRLKIAFGDAAGQPLKTATVDVGAPLAAGETREQSWTVPVDRSHAVERYVMDLPLSALTVKVEPVVRADSL